jgi:hypothetical protein
MTVEMILLNAITKQGSADVENFTHTNDHEWLLITLVTNKLLLIDGNKVYPTPWAYELVHEHAQQTN